MAEWKKPTKRGRLLVGLLALGACAGREIEASEVLHHEPGSGQAGRVLVLHGTRAGSTVEVAELIGRKLAEAGWSVDVGSVKAARDLEGYQAVVIGSAVRKGRVLPEVRDLVRAHRSELQRVPVAYFVVCMTMREDTPASRAKASAYLDPLRAEVLPVDVGLFAGKVDPAKLDGLSRLMLKMADVPAGDFRDWTAIEAWAGALATKLAGTLPREGRDEEQDRP